MPTPFGERDEGETPGMQTGAIRRALKRVPGLVPAYRALRAGCWRLRAALPLGRTQKRRVATHWGEAAERREEATHPTGWLNSDQVLAGYVFPRFGGLDWYTHLLRRFCTPTRALGLSLCCGSGDVERTLIARGICGACDGLDISPDAIAICREAAESAEMSTLSYRVADVERIGLPLDRYDLVVAWSALHHLQRLSRVLREVRRALRPEGIFVVNEYVGPARFQIPGHEVELVNEWLAKLPEELRRLPTGGIKQSFRPPTVADMMARDPSEAVRSHTILPLIRRQFVILEQIDYGGVLLHWLLSDIIANFDPSNAQHQAWLERLYAAEREVLERGELQSDFTFIVAQKRDQGARARAGT